MAKHELPKRIYVKRETDPNDKSSTWLMADESLNGFEDGDTIGSYELVARKTMRVTKTLE